MYTFDSRVRYSETDPQGRMSLEAVIDYLQDCSTFQSEDLGVGLEFMREHDVAWIVNFWQIDVLRMPVLGEQIRIGTSPYELRGFMGLRNFMIEDQDGTRLVNANSIWSLFNLEKGMPVRVMKEMAAAYELYPRFDMDYQPRKVKVPAEGGREMEPIRVSEAMLDSNHHVNNGQYIRLAAAYLPEGTAVRRLVVEYKSQARLGDIIYPICYDNDRFTVALNKRNEDGTMEPYAVVAITHDTQDIQETEEIRC